ncbi:hypothetical protein BOTNAR_0612g00030 [Botryotinia narcissicola]|uniref:2EXR domain-containing protein n=1 Tax=Botryotinia narcissicola TaxID=278944 RepID=A0A4Z1HMA7_9HELO|nr:hypothetical protein BOTNAR_0612g00030 [Botryotinia narcissicola]
MSSSSSQGIMQPGSTNATLPVIPSTFPKFQELSFELREMIWKLTLPGARIIDVVYDPDQDKYSSFHSKPPSLLHTNKEARSFAQKVYNLCFPTPSYPANIYIRYDIDVVYFSDWLTGYKYEENGWFEHVSIGPLGKMGIGRQDLKSITRVAVNSIYFDVPERFSTNSMEFFCHATSNVLARFSSLKRLYVVVEDINPYQKGEITLHDIPANIRLHPPVFCAFCGAHEIVRGFTDVKWDLTCTWRVPSVSVVGAARDGKLSHMGQYQRCGCNNFPQIPGVTYQHPPCEEYRPKPAKIAVQLGDVDADDDIPKLVEDDLLEEEWGLAENELDELISDEEVYYTFVAEYCEGEYGVNHEKWLGIDYMLSRPFL